jgi:hypothetical protein
MNIEHIAKIDDWEIESALNNNLIWLLKRGFYGTCIGEILKAVRGGSVVGAFTLSLAHSPSLNGATRINNLLTIMGESRRLGGS